MPMYFGETEKDFNFSSIAQGGCVVVVLIFINFILEAKIATKMNGRHNRTNS